MRITLDTSFCLSSVKSVASGVSTPAVSFLSMIDEGVSSPETEEVTDSIPDCSTGIAGVGAVISSSSSSSSDVSSSDSSEELSTTTH